MQEKPTPNHILDARGLLCPQPLIRTRRLWKTLNTGETFRVLLDNEIANTNLLSFLKDQNAQPVASRDGSNWVIDAIRSENASSTKPSAIPPQPSPLPTSPVQAAASQPEGKARQGSHYVVVLNSDAMGQGDDDLGRILIKGYISTLLELDNKPSAILMYNGGARLAARGSGADQPLKALEEQGIDIVVCGACVDFFELKGQLATGRISNMYEIADILATAGHVVYP